jgi:hypothetical protein
LAQPCKRSYARCARLGGTSRTDMLREASTSTTRRPGTFCKRSVIHCGCSTNASAARPDSTRAATSSARRRGTCTRSAWRTPSAISAANAAISSALTSGPPGLPNRMLVGPSQCTRYRCPARRRMMNGACTWSSL